ncbi:MULTISPECIES: phosphoribosylglycinamide formyltransferase [unclassified Aureimonas]
MGALVEAAKAPDFPGEIVAVIADKANAGGLELAHELGIEATAVPRQGLPDKATHEAAVIAAIEAARPDLICLAGYMRLLSAEFCERFAGRMINIHPSLLPLFPGLDTHARALAAGVRLHGASVHFVTFEMDGGPIIAQAAVPVEPGDTPDDLAARVLKAEHQLYPHALRLVLDGYARFVDGRTEFGGLAPAAEQARLISPALG